MTMFGTFSAATQKLIKRAVEDEAFRAKLFADKESMFGYMGIPEADVEGLNKELFAGVTTEEEFEQRLKGAFRSGG